MNPNPRAQTMHARGEHAPKQKPNQPPGVAQSRPCDRYGCAGNCPVSQQVRNEMWPECRLARCPGWLAELLGIAGLSDPQQRLLVRGRGMTDERRAALAEAAQAEGRRQIAAAGYGGAA